MKKKLWTVLAIVVISSLGLAACGPTPTPVPTDTPTPVPTDTPTPVPPTDTPVPPTDTPTPVPPTIHRVLIVIRRYVSADMPYMTDNELGVMIDMLEDADCKVWVASISDDPYESETRTVTPDIMVDSVDVEDFDAVILPCLAAYAVLPPREIIELVGEFNKQKKVIAAQYNARLILRKLDIVTTDQMTSSGVIQEGRIITSGCCPYAGRYYGCEDGTRALIEKVITALNEGV